MVNQPWKKVMREAFRILIFLPLPLIMIGAVWNLIKYENCRKNISKPRRILSDLAGPFSLLLKGVEPCECKKILIKSYIFAGGGFLYSAILMFVA
ncbi:MAG: hypothetical protein JSS56_26445 [Proteobacteria bacterium]|nr:hypothetical protein [Pseudomonadota bacterium]